MSQCPQCYTGTCRRHPRQDHGRSLAQPANKEATLQKMYELMVGTQLQKLQAEAARDTATTGSRAFREELDAKRDKSLRRQSRSAAAAAAARRDVAGGGASGLNPQALAALYDDDSDASNSNSSSNSDSGSDSESDSESDDGRRRRKRAKKHKTSKSDRKKDKKRKKSDKKPKKLKKTKSSSRHRDRDEERGRERKRRRRSRSRSRSRSPASGRTVTSDGARDIKYDDDRRRVRDGRRRDSRERADADEGGDRHRQRREEASQRRASPSLIG